MGWSKASAINSIKRILSNQQKGLLIAIEGADGAGKTTLCHHIENDLKSNGVDVLYVRNPGSDEVTTKIRDITKSYKLDWFTGYCLFMASLKHMMDNTVKPALEQNKVVILDRFIRSTYIYQMFYHRFEGEKKSEYNKRLKMFKDMVNYCIGDILKDRPFREYVIMLHSSVAWDRVHDREANNENYDVFESEKSYFCSIHDAYTESMDYFKDPICVGMQNNTVLNGNLKEDEILSDFYFLIERHYS